MNDRLRQIYNQGIEQYRAGRHAEAEKLLSEFVVQAAGFADVHNILGVLLAERNEIEQAVAHFRQALEINPRYSEARVNLMALLDSVGRMKEAEAIFASTSDPSSRSVTGRMDPYTEGKLANLHAEIGDIYQNAGFYDEAIEQYRRALALRPEYADIRVKLGIALRDKGYTGQAIEAFEQALKDKPGNAAAALNLGIAYYSSGRMAEAIKQWKAVLDRDPHHRLARIYIGMAEKKPGA